MCKKFLILSLLTLLCGQSHAFTVYKYTDENGVVTYTDKAKSGAKVFVFSDRMVERIENDVKLETRKHAAGDTLLVRNDLYAPVEIELRLEKQGNLAGGTKKPVSWVLPPRSKIRLLTLAPQDASKPMQYTPKLRYALGDPRLLPTTSEYQ